jgi:hypothetical protein
MKMAVLASCPWHRLMPTGGVDACQGSITDWIRAPRYTTYYLWFLAGNQRVQGAVEDAALANEWAVHNINVNAIAPGYMATDNTAALRADQDRSQSILARIPAGRWGTPEDLGGVVVFLASDAARYMHGSIVPVDGGWLAR